MPKLTIGRIVWYRTDGRNGLVYDLPAMITCTQETHPGDYPDGSHNPLPVPSSPEHVHLTVFTPGGMGTKIIKAAEEVGGPVTREPKDSADFVDADELVPGSGTYVELDVPYYGSSKDAGHPNVPARTWRWPVIA